MKYDDDIAIDRCPFCGKPDPCKCVAQQEAPECAEHTWVDLDPADPEVGPQPDIECEVCGAWPEGRTS